MDQKGNGSYPDQKEDEHRSRMDLLRAREEDANRRIRECQDRERRLRQEREAREKDGEKKKE